MVEIDLTAPNGRCEVCGEPKEKHYFPKCDLCFEVWKEERFWATIDGRDWP